MNLTGDPQIDKAVVNVGIAVGKEVFASAWKSFTKVPQWIQDKYREHDPFSLEAKLYCERIEGRYNTMRIIGMSRPMPIRNIFVRVNILKKISARHRSTIDELEQTLNSLDSARESVDSLVQYVLNHNSSKVFTQLIRYVQLTRLLVNCLNVDAYITLPVREQIVSSILSEK